MSIYKKDFGTGSETGSVKTDRGFASSHQNRASNPPQNQAPLIVEESHISVQQKSLFYLQKKAESMAKALNTAVEAIPENPDEGLYRQYNEQYDQACCDKDYEKICELRPKLAAIEIKDQGIEQRRLDTRKTKNLLSDPTLNFENLRLFSLLEPDRERMQKIVKKTYLTHKYESAESRNRVLCLLLNSLTWDVLSQYPKSLETFKTHKDKREREIRAVKHAIDTCIHRFTSDNYKINRDMLPYSMRLNLINLGRIKRI